MLAPAGAMRLECLLFPLLVACSDGSSSELDRLLEQADTECGRIDLDHTSQMCPDTAAALRCFDDEAAPHIEQVFVSEEGDPIVEHFFLAGGSIILLRDTREDGWGPQGIARIECTALGESGVTANGCTHIVCE